MVDNSIFTGEFKPLSLTSEEQPDSDMLDARNIAFFGTTCVFGQGRGIVIRTGGNTVLGQLAKKTDALNFQRESKFS